ncbi:hypothetical protein ACW14Y_06835 [Kitasatospora sp. cg17-2]
MVEPLQDVLEQAAFADGSWARRCMYRANDAMYVIADLVGVIAAHLEYEGARPESVQRLLRIGGGSLGGVPPVGRWITDDVPERMPERIRRQVWDSLAFVTLRLPVLVRSAAGAGGRRWPGRCLRPAIEAMDELDRLVGMLVALQANPSGGGVRARYRHVLQWRPRTEMPSGLDHEYLRELTEVPLGPEDSLWYLGAGFGRRWGVEPGRLRHMVFTMLTLLDEGLRERRWAGADGRPLPAVRNAALSGLAGLDLVLAEAGGEPLSWLTGDERLRARGAAAAMIARAGRGLSATADSGPELLRPFLRATPARGHR